MCVDSPQGLALALANGADRIELCSALSVGGLTPSHGFMQTAAAAAAAAAVAGSPNDIPLVAMVRPRAGDFVYTSEELEVMKADIRAARAAGLAGVVVGASRPDGSLDASALAALVEAAKAPMGQEGSAVRFLLTAMVACMVVTGMGACRCMASPLEFIVLISPATATATAIDND